MPTSAREPLTAEPIGTLIDRERAHLQAEERADRAEREAASLRATLAVLASVAEVSIEAAGQLVDEARRYTAPVADSAGRADVSTTGAQPSDAQRVINEARAAVAQLRADLLEDLADDEPAMELPDAAEDGPLQFSDGPGSATDAGTAPGMTSPTPVGLRRHTAPGLGWISAHRRAGLR